MANTKQPSHIHNDKYMLSVEDALARILKMVSVLEPTQTSILDTLDQILSENVFATMDIPPLPNSAMDGYAVRATDLSDGSLENPIELRVIDSIAAGELPSKSVEPRTAIRIMTGAPIPSGADAVVAFENTDEIQTSDNSKNSNQIKIFESPDQFQNIRASGQDIAEGALVLKKGTLIRPAEVGLLASMGLATASIFRKPKVGILATGNELLEPGTEQSPGMIYDSNSYGVAAATRKYGGIPEIIGIAKDNHSSIEEKLKQSLEFDILITSAGVSVGDYDVVKNVLSNHGKIDFWSVNMRPAKPLAFGVLNGYKDRQVPLIGLPGNPVSALVAFEQFVRPAIRKMQGKNDYGIQTIKAILDEPIHNVDGRRVYARAIVSIRDGKYHAKLTGDQSSNLLTSMSQANGLAICPENIPVKLAGEIVDIQILDRLEDII
ncbi:MAG: gephyrin-like molybdotransferase Glp [Chloroflexota bacterium]|nr:gephyrin-like molybdotransferase Glp [Chloroflexota bacterium]